MRVLMRVNVAVCTLLAATAVAGCSEGDGLPRQAVSGAVTLNNKPLATGVITFLPNAQDVATQGGGVIMDGKYSIPRESGLVPGSYKVVISSGSDTPEKKTDTNDMPGMPPVVAKDAVPSQYNTASVLTAEVKDGGKNVFEFNLTALPGKK
ncbi:MAG: hypothetical protein U0835_22745 [Isosphaeraceae bacterium]